MWYSPRVSFISSLAASVFCISCEFASGAQIGMHLCGVVPGVHLCGVAPISLLYQACFRLTRVPGRTAMPQLIFKQFSSSRFACECHIWL